MCSALEQPEQKVHINHYDIATTSQPISGEKEPPEKKCLAVWCPLETLRSPNIDMDRRAEAFSLGQGRADSFMAQQQLTAVGSPTVRGFLPDQISLIHFMSLTELFYVI